MKMKGPADWFTGDVYIDMIPSGSAPSRLGAANVHFTPAARTVWHTHPLILNVPRQPDRRSPVGRP